MYAVLTHFANELRSVRSRGASCAIDAFMEVYYYGMYLHDKNLHTLDEGIFPFLNNACYQRSIQGTVCSGMREDVWDWLVQHMPEYFSPKGRNDADISAAFMALGETNSLQSFTVQYFAKGTCVSCQQENTYVDSASSLLHLNPTSVVGTSGEFTDVFHKVIEMYYQQWSGKLKCSVCYATTLNLTEGKVRLPDFLLLDLPVLNGRNLIKPPLQLPHFTNIDGNQYTLTAAVQLNPGHFWAIVNHQGRFWVLDDMAKHPAPYLSFSGAVEKDPLLISHVHTTNALHNAVHLIVMKCSTNGQSRVISLPVQKLSKRRQKCMHLEKEQERINEGVFDHISHNQQSMVTDVGDARAKEPQQKRESVCNGQAKEQQQKESVSSPRAKEPQQKGESVCNGRAKEQQQKESVSSPRAKEPQQKESSVGNGVGDARAKKPQKRENVGNGVSDARAKKQQKRESLGNGVGDARAKKQQKRENVGNGVGDARAKKQQKREGLGNGVGDASAKKQQKRESLGNGVGDARAKKQQKRESVDDGVGDARVKIQRVGDSGTKSKREKSKHVDGDAAQMQQQEEEGDDCALEASHIIKLMGKDIECVTSSDQLFVSCADIVTILNIGKHIKKEGYALIKKKLTKNDIDPETCFISRDNNEMLFMSVNAILCMLGMKIGNKIKKNELRKSLFDILQKGYVQKLQMCSSTSPTKSRSSKSPLTQSVSKKPRLVIQKSLSKKKKAGAMKKTFIDIYRKHFRGKKEFLEAMSSLVRLDSPNSTDFDGTLSKEDCVEMLSNVKKKKSNLLNEIIEDGARSNGYITAEDCIYMSENYSGTRFVEELRKRLPKNFATRREEQTLRDYIKIEFASILIPTRTATGWMVSPERLLEVLRYKMYYLESPQHWKVYGDGRVIGGRSSTFISVNILNNEAFLYDVRYQNPKEVYPVTIFYEGDSRDNIEENIGKKAGFYLTHFLAKEDHIIPYLAGDEMFFEAVLDGRNILCPKSDTGWNIYHEMNVETKGVVSDVSGLRTDLCFPVNRCHPDSLLPSIPISSTVMCILHGFARSVEKFLNLEIQEITSEANKLDIRGQDGQTYKIESFRNLESAVNSRGIRQGNFKIHLNVKGEPEPVKLNKDHAEAIVSPPPAGKEKEFPHIMKNVINNHLFSKKLPDRVCNVLGLKAQYTNFELVSDIWHHFYQCIKITRNDPDPVLKEDKPKGSLKADDYEWGYTVDDHINYKHHAECFYQLFVLRYGSKHLTPYMMKFVDQVPLLMKSLPFSLGRYQSEGGEHANYLHNCFYYQHTTRHGGKTKTEPLVALLSNMWKNLRYEITALGNSDNADAVDAASAFTTYCKQHVAAATIQKAYKGFLIRQRLKAAGWIVPMKSLSDIRFNASLGRKVNFPEKRFEPVTTTTSILGSCNFVLVGTVPKLDKKYTQTQMTALITKYGGRVKSSLSSKGASTKSYIILTTQNQLSKKKLPSVIHTAMRRRYRIVSYTFVTDSINRGELQNVQPYELSLKNIAFRGTPDVTLASKHFSKAKQFVSFLKKRRAKQGRKQKAIVPKVARTPAQYYAFTKRTAHAKDLNSTPSFKYMQKMFVDYMKEWNHLSLAEKVHHKQCWQEAKEHSKAVTEKIHQLESYNKIHVPAYTSF
jgi:hypothetical protein